MNLNRDIALRVGALLDSQHKTRVALAEAMGMSVQALSSRLSGEKSWTVDDVVTAAGFLEVHPSVLLGSRITAVAA